MTGVYERDDGQMFLEGREINPHSPYEAQTLGISTVYQEVNLIRLDCCREYPSGANLREQGPWIGRR